VVGGKKKDPVAARKEWVKVHKAINCAINVFYSDSTPGAKAKGGLVDIINVDTTIF